MRLACLILAAALPACGAAEDGTGRTASPPARATAAPAPTPAPAGTAAANPLIGVWARTGGGSCRADQIEFTATQMTWESSPSAPMTTVAIRYDLSDPRQPIARPAAGEPFRFRVIDADHLSSDGDCVLARAD